MPMATEHADALRMEVSGVEVMHLDAMGTIPGVVVDAVAARNGPGTGRLQAGTSGATLRWQAPDSSTFGPAVSVPVDGTYLLEDGEDSGSWIRVTVHVDHLQTHSCEALVYLEDRWENDIAHDDVTASEALSGDVVTYTVDLTAAGGVVLSQLKIWINSGVSGLEISDDGASWVSPTTEGTALELPDLVPGIGDTLHLRRTIGAATEEDAEVLNHLHLSFCGV